MMIGDCIIDRLIYIQIHKICINSDFTIDRLIYRHIDRLIYKQIDKSELLIDWYRQIDKSDHGHLPNYFIPYP